MPGHATSTKPLATASCCLGGHVNVHRRGVSVHSAWWVPCTCVPDWSGLVPFSMPPPPPPPPPLRPGPRPRPIPPSRLSRFLSTLPSLLLFHLLPFLVVLFPVPYAITWLSNPHTSARLLTAIDVLLGIASYAACNNHTYHRGSTSTEDKFPASLKHTWADVASHGKPW